MMLGHPERVVAALVHALGVAHHLAQRLGELLLRIVALVDRRAGVAEVFHVGGAVIGAVEFRDHRLGPRKSRSRLSPPPPVLSRLKSAGRHCGCRGLLQANTDTPESGLASGVWLFGCGGTGLNL